MKVAVMQPYFLPYLGYFSLIKHTDRFILFDTVQFIKQGWIKRNRILKPKGTWQYITVPVKKHSRETIIKDIEIIDNAEWGNLILQQLGHYKKIAPFYKDTMTVLQEAFNIETNSIVKLNKHSLETICAYIGVNKKIEILSDLELEIEEIHESDEWGLNICRSLGNVTEYWNPENGASFYHREKYEKGGIPIKFLKIRLPAYPQGGQTFEPALSIVDVMMFNDPEKINTMLDDFMLF